MKAFLDRTNFRSSGFTASCVYLLGLVLIMAVHDVQAGGVSSDAAVSYEFERSRCFCLKCNFSCLLGCTHGDGACDWK